MAILFIVIFLVLIAIRAWLLLTQHSSFRMVAQGANVETYGHSFIKQQHRHHHHVVTGTEKIFLIFHLAQNAMQIL